MSDRKPNILFILADDLGWRDLACQGSEFYETPNLDKLAARGVSFTDGYAACPVCSPTRASILSGKYPARVGVTDWIGAHTRGKLVDAPYIDHLPAEEHSLAAALRDGGYQTWHVGKWHCGGAPFLPQNHGFDVNIGGCHQGSPGGGGYFSPWTVGDPELKNADVPDGTYLDDHLTDRAIGLIQTREADRPFFMHMSFYLVHTPIQGKPDLIEKYKAKAEHMGLDPEAALVEGELFPCEHKKDRRIVRRTEQSDPVYAAMVETMDTNIGRLLDALEAAGQLDHTLVIFTSDNGGLATAEGSPTCNAPLSEGKGWMYEGGTREPLIVAWPGHTPQGAQCPAVVTSPDFYPTLLDAAGLDRIPDQHVDGVSFFDQLTEPDQSLERDAVFWHYPHYGNQGGTPASSVRSGDYKLIEFFETGRRELYNLRDDLSEDNDLAADDPVRTAKLHTLLTDWRTEIEAEIPEPNPDFMPWRDDHEADPTL